MQQTMQQMPLQPMSMQQMQALQQAGHMGYGSQGGGGSGAGRAFAGGNGAAYGYPGHDGSGQGGQQPGGPQTFMPMQGPPMGSPGMTPYTMDGHGPPQAMMMMMQPGVPGGYVMVNPNMQGMMLRGGVVTAQQQDPNSGQSNQGHHGMQDMQGIPPNMLMMVQPGLGNMPNMQVAMQAPTSHGQNANQDGQNAALMMMSMPTGAMGGGQGGMNQVAAMGQGLLDADGKGSRVAALNRSSQPKQGAGAWHGGDRRSARPPAPGSTGMDSQGHGMQGFQFQGQVPQMAQGTGSSGSGGGAASEQAGQANNRMNRIANPKNPWADIQDAPHGALDQETREMWQLRPGQTSSRMGDTPPQRSQMQQMPKQMQSGMVGTHTPAPAAPPGRTKVGRNEGGKGTGGDSKKGSSRASPQEAQPAQKWVEVRPVEPSPVASSGGKGKGSTQHQDRWEPKEMVPKAAMPVQHVSAQPMIPPPSAGKGGGASDGGGKKKSRRDHKLDDWLSQRWAGRASSPGVLEGDMVAPATAAADTWPGNQAPESHIADSSIAAGYNDAKDASYEDYEEEADGRRGKKKGGKGGKGKADDRRREKGKGKGKSSRGWWRAQN